VQVRVAGTLVEIIKSGEQRGDVDWLEPLKIEKPA